MLRVVGALAVLCASSGAGQADPPRGGVRVVPATGATTIPTTIFLNRCAGGCTVKPGLVDDARTHTSTVVPGAAPFTISEFVWGDAVWNELVVCLKEVFSPYPVTITEVQPAPTVHYGEAIIAGTPGEVAINDQFTGYAPFSADCSPIDYAISFTFANVFVPEQRVHNLCWIAAQEIAHTYGLDHEFEFLDDGTSTCNDPMTYRSDCGGQRFFRSRVASCGEFEARSCKCGAKQSSHATLAGKLGLGTPTTAPEVTFTSPSDGATIPDGITVHILAFAKRGVTDVELLLNGYKWFETKGVPFGPMGQPAADYTFTLPLDVPDGIIEIEATTRDDLDISSSATVTVTKGAPCTSAATCAEGQRCEEGRCFWDPPVGAVGDPCSYPQFCEGARCDTVDGESFCTATCDPRIPEICGAELECRATSELVGFCWPPPTDSGGCCGIGRDRSPWGPGALCLALVFVLRRRSRSR